MKNFSFYFLVCLFVLSNTLKSANYSDKDSILYYENLSNKLLIAVGINSTFSDLTIKKSGYKDLLIKPLGQTSFAFGFNYKWLGFELGIGLPPNQLEKDRKENTSKLDLQLNIYSRRIGADLFFQHYKGFHLSNPGSFTT